MSKKTDIIVVILAAGRGARMKSKSTAKVMHKIAGLEMLYYVLNTAIAFAPKEIIIVVNQHIKDSIDLSRYQQQKITISLAIQEQQLGTASAVICATKAVASDFNGEIIVLPGDTPLITHDTLFTMYNKYHSIGKISNMILGFIPDSNDHRYGRMKIVKDDQLQDIIEYREQSLGDREKYKICNSGIMILPAVSWQEVIYKIDNKNKSGEYYLTDIVRLCHEHNIQSSLGNIAEYTEVIGINDKYLLSIAENIMQSRLKKNLMKNGVSFLDPNTVYLFYDTVIGEDSIIHANVVFNQRVRIGNNVQVHAFSHLEDVIVQDDCQIGPFARIKEQTIIAQDSTIGNFVEIKRSVIGNQVKIKHLSYIGDAKIGNNTNIGAGTVICNYDGKQKQNSDIADNVFIGSNTTIVSPVTIGSYSFVAAASVITRDVDERNFSIARVKQRNISNKNSHIQKK